MLDSFIEGAQINEDRGSVDGVHSAGFVVKRPAECSIVGAAFREGRVPPQLFSIVLETIRDEVPPPFDAKLQEGFHQPDGALNGLVFRQHDELSESGLVRHRRWILISQPRPYVGHGKDHPNPKTLNPHRTLSKSHPKPRTFNPTPSTPKGSKNLTALKHRLGFRVYRGLYTLCTKKNTCKCFRAQIRAPPPYRPPTARALHSGSLGCRAYL